MNYFQLAMIIIPMIKAFVATAEDADKDGKTKKEVVMLQLKQVWELAQATGSIKEIRGVPWEAVEVPISGLVDIVVGGLNMLGIFRTSK